MGDVGGDMQRERGTGPPRSFHSFSVIVFYLRSIHFLFFTSKIQAKSVCFTIKKRTVSKLIKHDFKMTGDWPMTRYAVLGGSSYLLVAG